VLVKIDGLRLELNELFVDVKVDTSVFSKSCFANKRRKDRKVFPGVEVLRPYIVLYC